MALALVALLAPATARAGGAVHLSLTLVAGGASNAWLEPGPQTPEAIGLLAPSLSVAWRGRRVGLDAGYDLLGTRYLVGEVTGLDHQAHLAASLWPGGGWRLRARLAGALTTYDATGPTGTPGTLPVLASASRAATVGLSARWRAGSWGVAARWVGSLRRSDLTLAGSATPVPVDEADHVAGLSLSWRPGPRAGLRVGPLVDLRLTDATDLAYTGAGVGAAAWLRAWRGGRVTVALRAQANVFSGTYARTDLFARLRLGVSQTLGDHLILRVSYAYSANGSELAAYDADRHLVLVSLEAGADLLSF